MNLSKKFYLITIGVFVVLMAILAVGDLDFTISQAIINTNSIWAKFFDIIGELPAYAGLLIATTLLYGGRNRTVKWWNITSSIIAVIFIVLFSFFVVFVPIRYIFHENLEAVTTVAYVVNILLSLTIAIGALYLAHTKGHKFTAFKKHAVLLIVLIVSEGILVNIIKSIWARPRMRSITEVSEFQHWYEINGWTTDNELKSFPSGHTSNAFVALAYMMFIPYIKSIKMKYFLITAIIWGTLVALSRVVLGAHFLSDVLVGSYITIFLFLIVERLILKQREV